MKDNNTKKTILSGIQPSGKLHIGNWAGAMRNWVELQNDYDCYFTIVDLHAITVRQNPTELRQTTRNMAAMLIACGIDPEKSTLFIQSQVPAHSQLAWVLNCFTPIGDLNRMTQFKDKSKKHHDNINAGLFTYPALQAADILLYQTDLVPVGNDQKQHLELTRNIADRFNNTYSPTFTLPEPYIPKIGARVMNLQEPTKKMSKSDENEKATIFLEDSINEIKNKIKRAVTDSENNVKYSDNQPGIQNLMSLYNLATGKSYDEIEKEFASTGYGDFKSEVAEAVANMLKPIKDRFEDIRNNKNYINDILSDGAKKANSKAFKTLRRVYKKLGFIQL